MSFEPPIAEKTIPVCYRHPDRPTRLSCGRCGKPLCPDCIQHGPVGVRCRECLQPVRAEHPGFRSPQRTGLALASGAVVTLVWVALFVGLAMRLVSPAGDYALPTSLSCTPNLLLSGIAGGLIGWVIWRICGRTCSRKTIGYAVAMAAAVPLLTVLILLTLVHEVTLTDWRFLLRLLAAIITSAAFSLLLTTQLHWDGNVHFDEL